ncbi:MAG: tetratricopeptide repeat protein [Gammaproteobacteria bacterium]|nr:tetratricopeptide repeat protein [Gammaproteobacteria bacterium]
MTTKSITMTTLCRSLGLIFAVLSSCLANQVQALEIVRFIETTDYTSVIKYASGLKLTDDGVIYVTSRSKGTMLKFTDGNIKASRLSPSVFENSELGGIEVLPNGNLVVVNESSGSVAILDPLLKPLTRFSQSGRSPGELNGPKPVAVSVNKNIYVGDVNNRQISVFNSQGLYLYSFGQHGSSGSDLKKPTHVSIDAEENVYVLEGPDRLSIFDLHGNLIYRIKSSELEELFGRTPKLSAMTTDLNGTLYLGDKVSNRISIFDWRKGEVLGVHGVYGSARSQYRDISYLSVNAYGQLAILDKLNNKVEIVQLDQTSFATPVARDRFEFGAKFEATCVRVAVFVNDKTLCIKPEDQGIVVLGRDGAELGEFAEFAEIARQPSSVHVGDQTVAVLDRNYLHAFLHDGKHIFSIGRRGSSPGDFNQPSDVFVHGGLYYVADRGNNRVQVFAADGKFLEEIKSRQNGENLFDEIGPIAVDSQQNLYVADGGALGVINMISKDRKRIATIGNDKKSAHKITSFYGLDIDKQDRLYALASTEFNDYTVMVYRNRRPYRVFGAEGENGTLVQFKEATSISVASAANNSVYVHDSELKQSFRFDLLEYPDAAFGLNIGADNELIKLEWSSSKSPLIARYEIQGAIDRNGPFETISTSYDLKQTLWVSSAGMYTWFRVVSISGRGLSATPSTPKENYYQRIVSLYQAGDLGEVVKLADRLLRNAPGNADARNILGMSLYQLKDYTRAIAEFKQLEAVESYRNKALLYQVLAFYDLEQYLDARALIDELLEQAPTDIEAYVICTRLSLKLADAIGAVSCAEDGLALNSSNVELRYLLGRAYIEAGLAEKGIVAYQAIVETSPESYKIRLKIAKDLYEMGSFEASLKQYDAVSRAQQYSGQAAVGKAKALLSLDRDNEARTIALKLSGKKETRGDGHYLLGKIAAKQNNHKEAVLQFTRAGKNKPGVVDVWLSLMQSYTEINQLPKAVKALAQGIKHNPQAFELYLSAGKIELERQQFVEANAYLDKAVVLEPNSLAAHKLYARGLFATRNYRSANFHAEAAARIDPEDVDVLVLKADIADYQGKTGSAIEFLKTAIDLDPASPDLQYRIGRVYQDANLFDISREHLEKAAGMRASWAEPHVALGKLYSKRRLFDDAVAAFEKAVELDPSAENRAILNVAFAERKKSLEFANNAPQLLLSDLNLQKVFSAAYKKYQDQPIGSVKLQNVSPTDYGNLKLSFQIKEFMDFPTSVDIARIEGNETLEIPIKATFNNKVLEVDEDTGVQVEVKLTYSRDGRNDDISLTQPMTIYGKNAMIWADSAMIGSFVTPKDDTLRDYVRQVVNTFQPDPGPLNDKLVSAMAFFSSLAASSISYIVDPNTPFTDLRDDQIDYVQFPRETLHLKSGDCDDLSVLISAGLENLGIKTALIEIPGHLFMMFDTGIAEHDAGLISQDSSLLAFKDGHVWIPLEATMVNTSFIEAWAEGANKYQAALEAGELGIIDLEQTWQEYKPVTLRKASYTIELPEKRRAESLVKQARNELLLKSIDRLVLPYKTMVANDPGNIRARLQIAILYARFGLYQDAELEFVALNELAPDDSAVKSNQGNLYFLQKEYNKAIEFYSRATELDNEDGGIWINLSMAQYRAGDLKQAKISYRRALQLNSDLEKEYDAYSKLLSQ